MWIYQQEELDGLIFLKKTNNHGDLCRNTNTRRGNKRLKLNIINDKLSSV